MFLHQIKENHGIKGNINDLFFSDKFSFCHYNIGSLSEPWVHALGDCFGQDTAVITRRVWVCIQAKNKYSNQISSCLKNA